MFFGLEVGYLAYVVTVIALSAQEILGEGVIGSSVEKTYLIAYSKLLEISSALNMRPPPTRLLGCEDKVPFVVSLGLLTSESLRPLPSSAIRSASRFLLETDLLVAHAFAIDVAN